MARLTKLACVVPIALAASWALTAQAQPPPASATPPSPEASAGAPSGSDQRDPGDGDSKSAAGADPEASVDESPPEERPDPPAKSAAKPALSSESEPIVTNVEPVANVRPLTSDESVLAEPPQRLPKLDDLGSHQTQWSLALGVKVRRITDRALDQFGEDDVLGGVTVSAGRTLFAHRSLSLVLGVEGDIAYKVGSIRRQSTTLAVQHFFLVPEIRNHLWARMFLFAKPAVGALHTKATLAESASGVELQDHLWGTALDLSAGAAYQVAGPASGEKRSARLWLTAEGGYSWSSKLRLGLYPADSSGPERIATYEMDELRLNGPLVRGSAILSF